MLDVNPSLISIENVNFNFPNFNANNLVKPEFISLLEAAIMLANHEKISTDKLVWVTQINEVDPLEGVFSVKKHEEIIPGRTIHHIDLTLNLCKKNGTNIYEKIPPSTDYEVIPPESLKYFDAKFGGAYENYSRENQALICSDIAIKKSEFKKIVKQTKFEPFLDDFKKDQYKRFEDWYSRH